MARVNFSELLRREEPLTWIFTGDSITHGLAHTQGARSYSEHFHEAIRGELARVRDAVINTAVSGQCTAHILEDFDRRIATWKPDVVSLMIGTNDCSTGATFTFLEPGDYARQVTELAERITALGVVLIMHTPPPVDAVHAPERARHAEFVAAFREVTEQLSLPLVDHHAVFTKLAAAQDIPMPWMLMSDPFHPNAAGHSLMAWSLLQELGVAEACPRTTSMLEAEASIAFPWAVPPIGRGAFE